MKSKDARLVQMRVFRCPSCGMIRPATKRRGKTQRGHVKGMYCTTCRKRTNHIQIE